MKTNEITAAAFAARFGSDAVKPGAFSYFVCDNGLGLIRNNADRTVELVQAVQAESVELSPEDELQLLTLVCGNFTEEAELPVNETVFDFENRERRSRQRLNTIWLLFVLFIVLMLAALAYGYAKLGS